MTVSSQRPRTSIPFEVWRIDRRLGLLLDVELAGLGCRPGEIGLYSVLLVGPMTPTDVARHSGLPPTTVSKMLHRVEDRGHLDRSANPEDGRSSLVALNAEGRAFHASALKAVQRVSRLLRESLDEDAEWVEYAVSRLERTLGSLTGGSTSPEEKRRWPVKALWEHRVMYEGDPLTQAEEGAVREYIDWLRWRRSREGAPA